MYYHMHRTPKDILIEVALQSLRPASTGTLAYTGIQAPQSATECLTESMHRIVDALAAK